MQHRNSFIGFGIAIGVIVLVSYTSRMTLQGSLVGSSPKPVSSSSSSQAAAELELLGSPLSRQALTRVQYTVVDPSVRFALSSAGRTFTLEFGADGTYKAPPTSSLKRTGIESAALHLDQVAVADVDGDRFPDSIVPVTVLIAGKRFTDIAVIRNADNDVGEYSTGYALGLGSQVRSITFVRGQGMLVKFNYVEPGSRASVAAQLLIAIAVPVAEVSSSVSSQSVVQ